MVLRNFVVDGRITQIPSAAGKRRILLDWLAQEFRAGGEYWREGGSVLP